MLLTLEKSDNGEQKLKNNILLSVAFLIFTDTLEKVYIYSGCISLLKVLSSLLL